MYVMDKEKHFGYTYIRKKSKQLRVFSHAVEILSKFFQT